METMEAASPQVAVSPEGDSTSHIEPRVIHVDWGVVEWGKVVKKPVELSNPTNKNITLRLVHRSCNCTGVDPEVVEIEAGGTGKVEVSFNASGNPGPQTSEIYFEETAGEMGITEVKLAGTVYRYSPNLWPNETELSQDVWTNPVVRTLSYAAPEAKDVQDFPEVACSEPNMSLLNIRPDPDDVGCFDIQVMIQPPDSSMQAWSGFVSVREAENGSDAAVARLFAVRRGAGGKERLNLAHVPAEPGVFRGAMEIPGTEVPQLKSFSYLAQGQLECEVGESVAGSRQIICVARGVDAESSRAVRAGLIKLTWPHNPATPSRTIHVEIHSKSFEQESNERTQ